LQWNLLKFIHKFTQRFLFLINNIISISLLELFVTELFFMLLVFYKHNLKQLLFLLQFKTLSGFLKKLFAYFKHNENFAITQQTQQKLWQAKLLAWKNDQFWSLDLWPTFFASFCKKYISIRYGRKKIGLHDNVYAKKNAKKIGAVLWHKPRPKSSPDGGNYLRHNKMFRLLASFWFFCFSL